MLNDNTQPGRVDGTTISLGTSAIYSTGHDITYTASSSTINFTAAELYEVYYAGDFTSTDTDDQFYIVVEATSSDVIPGAGISAIPNSKLIEYAFNNTFYVSTTTTESIYFTLLTLSSTDILNDFTVTVRKVVL